MPRYEFVEGTSSKFWEITLDGTSFTTRYGKIGTAGQSTTKDFDSPEKAKKEHDKLVAEKTKKGYQLVSGGSAPAPAPAKAPASADAGDEDEPEEEAPKAKPAKAAKAPAAAAPAPAGEARYEFVEGTSSKFWAVSMSGNSVTTRWGKIGTDGQTGTKDYGSPDKAKKEYDKLVAEKTKKGYRLVSGGGAPAATPVAPTVPAAPAAPAPAAAPAAGEQRYEFSEGTSSKFWAIKLEGSSFTVRFGKIGTDGQSSTKTFADAAAAKKEADKLIAEKTKKGYQLASGGGGGGDAPPPGGAPPARAAQPLVGLEKEIDVNEHAEKFIYRRVVNYDPEKGLTQASKGVAYRVPGASEDGDFEERELEQTLELLNQLLDDENAAQLQALVIGPWALVLSEPSSEPIIDALVAKAKNLPELKALFLGDIVQEESEVSWIHHGDVAPLFKAFPKLEHLRVRGIIDSMKPFESDALRSLVIQCGVPSEVVKALGKSRAPNLEHLELWLGTPDYEGTATVDDLAPILSGKLFPKLRYLGLRNSAIADEVAAAVASSPILERIEVLDLSNGTLGDAGAEALLASPGVSKLKRLALYHNYVTEANAKKLKALRIDVDVRSGDPDEYEGERFVAVGE